MSNTAQPLVSIVTPVYQGAEYLRECIESILAQTYQNWDYVIVDNCSTDGSAEIAQTYADKDSRIRVHRNQEFLDAIPNHNASLRQIHKDSKYCKVVFADDWISPVCLKRMVALAEQHPTVGLVSANCLEGQQIVCTGLPQTCEVISGYEVCREHLLNKLYLFGSANSLLYRGDLVRSHDPFYNENNIHADTEACFAVLQGSDFGFVHEVLTFTRLRPGSLNTVSLELHSYFAGMLQILRTYGTHYLSTEELDKLRDQHLAEYYKFLGKSVFLGRDKKFWNYHAEKLSELGLGLSWTRLGMAALANLFSATLRPRDAFGKLLRSRTSRAQ